MKQGTKICIKNKDGNKNKCEKSNWKNKYKNPFSNKLEKGQNSMEK